MDNSMDIARTYFTYLHIKAEKSNFFCLFVYCKLSSEQAYVKTR